MRVLMRVLSFNFILFVSMWATVVEATPEIQLHEEVTLQLESDIRLGDVATFSDIPKNVLSELRSAKILETLASGEAKTFSNTQLSQLLRQPVRRAEEALDQKIRLVLPEKMILTRTSPKLQAADVERALSVEFKRVCMDCEFEINNLSLPLAKEGIDASKTWKIKTRDEIPKGSFSLPLEVTNDDATRRLYWISGQVVVRKVVPVVRRQLQAGERVSEQDLAFERRDITQLSDTPAKLDDLKDAALGQPIAANQILLRGSLKRDLALRSGETIRVSSGSTEWSISIEGVAQQGGYIGDLIKVKIPRTQKLVSGVIVGKGMVELR